MDHSWIYNALEAAYQACGDSSLANYSVMEENDDYVEIYLYADNIRAINVFRRIAANYKPYYWRMNVDGYSYGRTVAKFWVEG